MSTRSYICIENSDDKKISGIYCHSDGYVSYVGFLLYNFYDTERKVRELIGLGSLSSLGVRIGHTVDFNRLYTDTNYYEANKMQCVAYCRDRQEHFEVYTSNSKEQLYKEVKVPYIYIFRNNKWYVKEGSNKLRLLENAIIHDSDILMQSAQKRWLTDKNLLEDEKKRIYVNYKKLGILKVNEKEINISNADFIIESQFDSNHFSVRSTVNNSYSCLTMADIQKLKQEGCKIEVKKGCFVKI